MKKRDWISGLLMFVILVFGILASQGFLDITISGVSGSLSIVSPQNITYNFDPGDDYTILLNATNVSFVADTWWYSLYDLTHGEIVVSDVISCLHSYLFHEV